MIKWLVKQAKKWHVYQLEEHLLEELLTADFTDFFLVQLNCPTKNNLHVSMAVIQILLFLDP